MGYSFSFHCIVPLRRNPHQYTWSINVALYEPNNHTNSFGKNLKIYPYKKNPFFSLFLLFKRLLRSLINHCIDPETNNEFISALPQRYLFHTMNAGR